MGRLKLNIEMRRVEKLIKSEILLTEKTHKELIEKKKAKGSYDILFWSLMDSPFSIFPTKSPDEFSSF